MSSPTAFSDRLGFKRAGTWLRCTPGNRSFDGHQPRFDKPRDYEATNEGQYFVIRAAAPPAPAPQFRDGLPQAGDRQVYFMHIAKTGGSSVRSVLRQIYRDSEICPAVHLDDLIVLEPAQLARYRLIMGHHGFSLVPLLPLRPRVITILREPVKRTLSHFEHIRVHEQHWLHDRIGGPSARLEDLLADDLLTRVVNNFQARNIVQDFCIADSSRVVAGLPPSVSPRIERLFAYGPQPYSDEALFDLAVERIESFDYVGRTEALDGTFQQLRHLFGWPSVGTLPLDNQRRKGSSRAEAHGLDETMRERIHDLNSVDLRLYDWLLKRERRGLGA